MASQKCEICGEWKETKEMSKSYKHRCKACVAELTRKSREHMPKSSGKRGSMLEPQRIAIATAAMQSIVSNTEMLDRVYNAGVAGNCNDVTKSIAVFAVAIADNMLAEMKGSDDGER